MEKVDECGAWICSIFEPMSQWPKRPIHHWLTLFWSPRKRVNGEIPMVKRTSPMHQGIRCINHHWLKNHGWETSRAPLPRSRSAPQVYQRLTCDVWRRCGEQIAPSESSNSRSECSIQTGEESNKKWGFKQRKWCFSQESCRFMQQNRGLRIVYIDIRMWDFDGFCRFCRTSLNIANC